MNLVKEKNKKNVFLKIFKTQLDIKDIYKDMTFKLTFFLYFNSAERKRGDILMKINEGVENSKRLMVPLLASAT